MRPGKRKYTTANADRTEIKILPMAMIRAEIALLTSSIRSGVDPAVSTVR